MATSRGFGPFSRRMDFRAEELRRNMNVLIRKIGLAADQAVVFSTPVDKGVARSNWRVSLNRPVTDTVAAYAPGENLGISETANAQAAINQGQTVISQRRDMQPIYISNNLPYIGALNAGSSRQAAAGFVEAAVTEAAVAVAQANLFPSP